MIKLFCDWGSSMFSRKSLKRQGKSAFYRNWKSCIIICFIYTILVGGTVITLNKELDFDYRDNIKNIDINNIDADTNSDIVNEFLNGLNGEQREEPEFFQNATRGALGSLVNNVSKSGSFLFGILNAINQALFKDRIWASVIIIIGALIALLYWTFVSKVIEVGNARFFLENRRYTKTKASKLILPYRLGKTTHVAYTMFLKNLYTILWGFTIIGGIIKYYSYYLVPYILAENPNMKTKDVLKLSRDMMNGYKWEMFKLDLSFIGYYLLGILTLNISNLVFATPYINATKAESYMFIRDISKTKGIQNIELLKDNNLEGEIVFEEYPIYEYMLKESKHRWLKFNYNRKYSITDIILIFFIVAIFGYIFEVLLHLFQYGEIVKRGTLQGPWLPIWGAGGVAMLVLLKPVRKNPFAYFVLAMLVSGIIEYGTSVYLELVHHMSWWDYHGYFLNINGRVCLEGLLLFATGGILITYIVAPIIGNLLDKVSKKLKIIVCIILVSLIAFDFYYSSKYPNTGEGVTNEITESKLEDYINSKRK